MWQNSKCDKTQELKMWQNSKCDITQKLNMLQNQNSKMLNLTKLKKIKCDKTKKNQRLTN